MKNLLFTTVVLCTLLTMTTTDTQAQTKKDRTLRHVVFFGFKSTATPEDIKKVEDAFAALPSKIKQIKAYEWGTNNSPEGLNQGHTHCFLLTFASEKDRDDYLVHPDHKAFGAILGPYLEKVTVLDFWSK